MSVWDAYSARIAANGSTPRERTLLREKAFLAKKLPGTLSYKPLIINGEQQSMAVLSSDNLNIKNLCSMPGEDIRNGSLVDWMDNKWLVIERDADNEVYTRAKMKQCNYLLKWVTDDDVIVERWCIVEDGTKYLIGETEDRDFIVTRGDSRIFLTLARDEFSVQLRRDSRFLIDDYESETVLAYRLTKPFKLGGSYNGEGVLNFVLAECNTEDSDNIPMHIANYYDHFPREADPAAIAPGLPDAAGEGNNERKAWF